VCRKFCKFKIPDISCEEILVNRARVELNDRLVDIYSRENFIKLCQFMKFVTNLITYTALLKSSMTLAVYTLGVTCFAGK
jgi:hypothetical protein